MPILAGKAPDRQRTLFWRIRHPAAPTAQKAVRRGKWKYLTDERVGLLFDLEADPGEKRNVLDDPKYQKVVSGLRAELEQFFETRGAPPIEQWRSTTKQKLFQYKRYSQ